jgi:hypothetical protein
MITVTDRSLPLACTIANEVITELTLHGHLKLADQVAAIHRATCDLAHAIWTERTARDGIDKTDASLRVGDALARLHGP